MGKDGKPEVDPETRAVRLGRSVPPDVAHDAFELRPRYLQQKDLCQASDLFEALQSQERFEEDWG